MTSAASRAVDRRHPVAAPGLVLMTCAIAACGTPDSRSSGGDAALPEGKGPEAGSTGTDAATGDGWVTLFDGDDVSAWRGYRRSDLPAGWRAQDGLLTFTPGGDGGDIITRDQYADFELELEWRVGPAGNTGIFYRATENFEVIWYGAPEMQILDDAGHPDGRTPTTSAGAAYALYAPTADVVRPAGEWNQARIVARGPHVEHWLNGVKIVEYEAWSEDWRARVRASKFVEYPGFGEARSGHVGLQDHGNPVWFRDVRIRPLTE